MKHVVRLCCAGSKRCLTYPFFTREDLFRGTSNLSTQTAALRA